MTKSEFFLLLCLSFIGGVFFGSFFSVSALLPAAAGLAAASFSPFFGRRKAAFALAASALAFLFAAGIVAFRSAEGEIAASGLSKLGEAGAEAVLTGVVAREPDERSGRAALVVEVESVVSAGAPEAARGKVLAFVPRHPEYRYGDRLRLAGKLEAPPVFDGFDYRRHLAKDGIFALMRIPQVEAPGEP